MASLGAWILRNTAGIPIEQVVTLASAEARKRDIQINV